MKRGSVIVVVSLVALAMAGAMGPVAAAQQAVAPKVVLIVGPAGAVTDSYRRLADEAATAAARYTPNVVRVYSPDATWRAVRQALQGASIVVYLGHGNGWPSRYRDSLYPATQDGFGLNPTAGAGDSHQYFGEDVIGREVRLAKHAVVVMSHLCYASGNSEPGLPEGPLAVGQQRVDNYAAGFIRAGAEAVIADAYLGPAYYVKSILAGKGTIDRIWRRAPSYNGNLLQFASLRSKGYVALMDTDTATAGFHRSLVVRAGATAQSVLSSATRIDQGIVAPPEPSIAGLGLGFEAADLAAPPIAGSKTKLTFKIDAVGRASLPKDLLIGVRWDPIQTDNPAVAGPAPAAAPGASPAASPTIASPDPAAAAPSPGGLTGPPASAAPEPVDDGEPLDLVSAEVPGEVVAPVPAKRTASGLSVKVTVPTVAGLYRLVASVHQGDGVAYDAASQALLPALIVRVTGNVAATYSAPAVVAATAGASLAVRVKVTNLGGTAWGAPAMGSGLGSAEFVPASRAMVVSRWVGLGAGSDGSVAHESRMPLPSGLAPRGSAVVILGLTAPTTAGEYLLLVDVLVPGTGSLAIAGVPPALVRVTVN